jgi:hypothetical protein
MKRLSPLTWESVAARIVTVCLPIILAILGFILVRALSWGLWVTASLNDIRTDIKVLKVANHLALRDPMANEARDPIFSLFGPSLPRRASEVPMGK